jgi:lysophospholipase L1-like esterase
MMGVMSRINLWFFALPLALLIGCPATRGDDDDDDAEPTPFDWGYESDEGVSSYSPEGYVAEDPARVIFLGDSITAGAGASSDSLAYPALTVENDDGEWSGWGDHDLRSVFDNGFEVVDVSRGGATTDTLRSQQLPALTDELGDTVAGETIVIMTVGGNDMQAALLPILNAQDQDAVANEAIGEVADNMAAVMDYFADTDRFSDGVFVYFANVYEPTDAVGQSNSCFFGIDFSTILRYFDQANDTMRSLAEESGAGMVDLRGHFLGHGVYASDDSIDAYDEADATEWFANDCIHPNDRGHHEIRRLFVTAVEGRPLEAFGEAP